MESDIQPPVGPDEARVLASLGRRVTAGLVDAVLMWPACAIGAFFVVLVEPLLPVMTTFEQCVFVYPVLLMPIMLVLAGWRRGAGRQTLGQRMAGISCVSVDRRGPSSWFEAIAHSALAIAFAPVMVIRLVSAILSGQCRPQSLWHDELLDVAVVDHYAWKEVLAGCCRNCGYDLRGSLRSGRCPECGRRIDMGTDSGESEVTE